MDSAGTVVLRLDNNILRKPALTNVVWCETSVETLFSAVEKKVLYETWFARNLKKVSNSLQIAKPFLGFV